jgi:hypothetical protein
MSITTPGEGIRSSTDSYGAADALARPDYEQCRDVNAVTNEHHKPVDFCTPSFYLCADPAIAALPARAIAIAITQSS